ncbi:MAG TPA: 2-oxo-4-hydroxy-4-carboxy-5-ureidoimidazoline decarboxylase [Gaiellaceae bacterium]|nr:2-oxo-4-hydroxy-4-carboxy-5-ureidoimidazoline decarboxylase [Gaiellaceae bacterium]
MHDLPRKLSAEELEDLFGARTRLVELLAEREDPLGQARAVLDELSEDERLEALAAHPRIGERRLSGRSAREQGDEEDPGTLAELARLNDEYERRFGFRFVVFVDGRPRSAIVPVLRERLARSREEELATACDELVAIARDRWRGR